MGAPENISPLRGADGSVVAVIVARFSAPISGQVGAEWKPPENISPLRGAGGGGWWCRRSRGQFAHPPLLVVGRWCRGAARAATMLSRLCSWWDRGVVVSWVRSVAGPPPRAAGKAVELSLSLLL